MSAVELRLGKIRRRLAQDLVGLPQLPVLSFQGLELAAISVVKPGVRPLSRSAFFSHSLSVCPVQPIFAAIETIAAQRDGCSRS